jgi:homogentisate 1,2-dioxygenase
LDADSDSAASQPTDFIDGLITMAGNGNTHTHAGVAIHIYVANVDDGSLFLQRRRRDVDRAAKGRLLLRTEMGVLEAGPGEIAVIQRGIRFRVELLEKEARGYICENYGALLRLPDLGPIGANGLANPRDFLAPVAAFEDREGDFRIVTKFQGRLWAAAIDHSPLNVVAWHGNYVPYKYDLANFNCINTVSFDHPDPSIYTVLTSPSEIPGTANVDFVIFPPRWMVRAYVSSAVVSSQLHERIHGADSRRI